MVQIKNLEGYLKKGIEQQIVEKTAINHRLELCVYINLITDYEGGKPDSGSNKYFELRDFDGKLSIKFKKYSDLSISIDSEDLAPDTVLLKIKKLVSNEESPFVEDDKRFKTIRISLVSAKKILSTVRAMNSIAYWASSAVEHVLTSIEQSIENMCELEELFAEFEQESAEEDNTSIEDCTQTESAHSEGSDSELEPANT
ncbi:hypothetical protein VCHA47P369_70358 [Vibrio chagasii]|nr:hypothetical protein VCHA48P435_60046 [Vibrio chagasii]CAH7353139.1 hypothetical protein VCHA47P369_70358 [Vibrio chagasii]CAH7385431.1 hypothetical protein VCHA51O448_60307 [Vibrio chagasii]